MSYPGYGGFSGAFTPTLVAPPADDSMWGLFKSVAGTDGEVDAQELQTCLTQSGFHSSCSPFSLDTCRIMIAMLDRDFSGKMGFGEFKELFVALNAWKQNFMTFDRDHSGTIEKHEMSQALNAMGYRVSPPALNAIMARYGRGGTIHFDHYVACCVKLRALTDDFRRRDAVNSGRVTLNYDDFILCTMAM